MEQTLHHLTSADTFCPAQMNTAYRVEEGEVFVYIVPWENGTAGRRQLLCHAVKKQLIPGFAYTDADQKQWRLLFISRGDSAALSEQPQLLTNKLKERFLQRCDIHTYVQEGFERSLVEVYKREEVKNRAFLLKLQSAVAGAEKKSYKAVMDVFSKEIPVGVSDNDRFLALLFISSHTDIPLVNPGELLARCGRDPGIREIAKASHFICRDVVLDPQWYKEDCGCLVGNLEGEVVACVPGKKGKYQLFRTSDASTQVLTPELAVRISPTAFSIGRTLPIKPLTKKDIFRFCQKSISPRDMIPVAILALICALIGVLLPTLNQMIYDDYIPMGDVGNLVQLCAVMLSFMIGNMCFSIVKNLFDFRVTSRVGNELQSAVYHRLFHLPESFFRDYDSADLAGRVSAIGSTVSGIANTLVITGISALFSLVYFVRMWKYSGKLSWVGLGMYLVYIVLTVWITSMARKREVFIAEADAEAESKLYQYLNGVDKIRMAGVEDLALLSFMRPYARQQSEEIRANRYLSAKEALGLVVNTIFSMVLYLIIVKSKIDLSIGAFVAFNTAFGSFTGALEALAEELLMLYQESEQIKRFWPVLEAVPEDDENKEVPGSLTGGISLEHVSFAYDQGGKNVINNMSLSIKPGEYVGIVGASGCGKSTLLKLLLGFETPQSGMILVDGKDLRSIDKGAYRRQLGVVLQNGKLISGSIHENITITAPQATMARVKEVIRQVGLEEDIKQMPMGIHTVLSENCNTISGGQQQRILIARAIVGSPAILIFDEATSALDNLTQAAVSSNLDKMNVTRIVVAHRLSTIKNCDRILVLNDGVIAEEGNYTQLMERKGLFYRLASRQIAQ